MTVVRVARAVHRSSALSVLLSRLFPVLTGLNADAVRGSDDRSVRCEQERPDAQELRGKEADFSVEPSEREFERASQFLVVIL